MAKKVNKTEKPKKQVNYAQLFTIQDKIESQIRQVCPTINHRSGIYFYTRVDIADPTKKACYIGKSVDILSRCISHQQGWKQRIDQSIRKRGYYSDKNLGGWKLNFLNFPVDQLDEKEAFYIDMYKNANYEMYNVESGGTTGKTLINERKPSKTYRDGIVQGQKSTKAKVQTYFTKYLDYSVKLPSTKIKEKKFAEFKQFLEGENKDE